VSAAFMSDGDVLTVGADCVGICGASLYGRRGGRFEREEGDAFARILLWAAD
jgi:hypothetical protein